MSKPPVFPTLLHAFSHWAKHSPNRIYLNQPYPDGRVETITWAEAENQVLRAAAYLKSLNLPPKSNITLLGKNSAHWILADLAIAFSGHVTVPLYPTLNADSAQYIFEHSETRCIILGKLDGKMDGWNEIKTVVPQGVPLIGLPLSPDPSATQWSEIIKNTAPMAEITYPQPSELATIVYTSGSTGRPKGVMHSFATMMAPMHGLNELFTVNADDRFLSYLPLAHVAERAIVESVSINCGCQIFFSDSLKTFQADLKRAKPTFFFSVPRLWTKFYLGINDKISPKKQKWLFRLPIISGKIKRKILSELGLDCVRAALTGSAPLPSHIIEWYRSLGLDLLDVYGMSENFGYSHASRSGMVRLGYVGNSNPGVITRIAESGEIQVKSPSTMLGYYKAPDKTAEDMTEDGYLKTGDRGEVDAEGRLRITGRVKELFKTSKGKYVVPVPVENKLTVHPAIESVCVTGPGQPQPFAVVMLSAEAFAKTSAEELQPELEGLLDAVNAQLEDHEVLDYMVIVKDAWTMDNGFLTPTMKIKRNVIEERYLPHASQWVQQKSKVIWE